MLARIRRIRVPLFAALISAGLAVATQGSQPLFYINLTASMPLGIYVSTGGHIKSGDIVVFPASSLPPFPHHNPLPPRLLKRAIFRDGSTFSIASDGLHFDSRLIAARWHDTPGLLLPPRALPAGAFIALGDHPQSLDSRYFGPVPLSSARPVRLLLFFGAHT